MATLEKIRNRGGLLIIIVGLAILAFIMTDFLRSGSTYFHESKSVAMNIDGKKIPIQEYQAQLNELVQMQEAGGRKLSGEDNVNLNNQLAQQMMNEYIVNKEAEALGITVSPEELLAMISGTNIQPSPMAGSFFSKFGVNPNDPTGVAEVLAQISDAQIKKMPAEQQPYAYTLRAEWNAVQKQMIGQRQWEKVSALLSRSYAINKIDAQFMSATPSRDVAVVRAATSTVSEEAVKVSPEEIKKFYDSHKELFVQKSPSTTISYIASEVRPSADDYRAAATEMETARQALLTEANVDDALRNYGEKLNAPVYFTAKELEQSGLPDTLVRFVRTAAVGQVNVPDLANDYYELIKLISKKTATEGMHLSIIQLDSATSAVDSIRAQFAAGTPFATLADKYNKSEQLRATHGMVIQQQQYGLADSIVTEAMAHQMGLDTVFKAPVGGIIEHRVPNSPAVLLVHTANAKPAVEKYRFAYVRIAAPFSEKTYNEKYSQMNNLLMSGTKYDQMAKDAQTKGLNVVDKQEVQASTVSLPGIRSSREVVSWAMRSDVGTLTDKLFICGENNVIIIASVKGKIDAGYTPMAEVQDQIKTKLMNDKRGEKLAADLKAQGLSSLGAYATAMNSKIDTLHAVSYIDPQQYGAEFNGYAMTTALDAISAPFHSGNDVIVVQPLRQEDKAAGQASETQMMMQRRRIAGQLGQRAFMRLFQDTKIVDNRANFF